MKRDVKVAIDAIDGYVRKSAELRAFYAGLPPAKREAVLTTLKMLDELSSLLGPTKKAITQNTVPGNFSYQGFTHNQPPKPTPNADPARLPAELLRHPGVVTAVNVDFARELVTTDPELAQFADGLAAATFYDGKDTGSVTRPAAIPSSSEVRNLIKMLTL